MNNAAQQIDESQMKSDRLQEKVYTQYLGC